MTEPPLGVAHRAASAWQAGFDVHVGEDITRFRPWPGRKNRLVQGLTFDEIIRRVPADSDAIENDRKRPQGIVVFHAEWQGERNVASPNGWRVFESLVRSMKKAGGTSPWRARLLHWGNVGMREISLSGFGVNLN